MKKLVVLGTALLALNAVASEIQVKAGYDFNRTLKEHNEASTKTEMTKGAVAGVEYIFDNQGEFEWGVGAEYKFSDKITAVGEKATPKVKVLRSFPVYTLGKFNLVTTKAGNDAVYLVGRAGYGFLSDVAKGVDEKGGLYLAAGLGTEHGPLSVEGLYERQNLTKDTKGNHLDTYGIRLGYRLGRLVNDRQPKVVNRVVEKVVEKVVEVPVQVPVHTPAPAPVVKTITNNTVALPFSCSTENKVCVIKGFKVDGREPNAQEAADLKAIANVINQFAEGGSINFVGHTDSTGSAAYNQKLSVARAQNVAKLLREYGLKNTVATGTITGKGLTQPADTNATVEGRYNNRRVELFFNNVDFTNVNFIK